MPRAGKHRNIMGQTVAVDLGATRTRVALIGEEGQIGERREGRTPAKESDPSRLAGFLSGLIGEVRAGHQEEVELDGYRGGKGIQAAAAGQFHPAFDAAPDQDVVAVFRQVHGPGYPGVGEFQARVLFMPAGKPLRAQIDGHVEADFGNGFEIDLQGLFRCHYCIINGEDKISPYS